MQKSRKCFAIEFIQVCNISTVCVLALSSISPSLCHPSQERSLSTKGICNNEINQLLPNMAKPSLVPAIWSTKLNFQKHVSKKTQKHMKSNLPTRRYFTKHSPEHKSCIAIHCVFTLRKKKFNNHKIRLENGLNSV